MHIALLIDCENAAAESIHGVLSDLAERGTVNVRRAYGNWKNSPSWEAKLHPFAIQPVQQFAYTSGKNASDMCMTVDAMELLFTEKLDAFALMTSDSDFTPLAMKLLSKGKQVIGFGKSTTPEPFRKACSVFIHTDGFGEPTKENPAPNLAANARRTKNELRGDTELMNALRAAVDAMAGDDGWAFMGRVGQHIANDAKLSSKNYGYARWSDLIRTTGYFDETVRDGHHFYLRRKSAAKLPTNSAS
jgi:uncharacterized protein (TIGR00288 family)